VYDFGGFSPELFRLRYDAAGAPALADELLLRLRAQGWRAQALADGGLDHGIWTSLRYAFPEADIPVLPLAWPAHAPPERLIALGETLAPLAADGVLIWATGSITHNLRRVFSQRQAYGVPAEEMPEIPESQAFRHWWAARTQEDDVQSLAAWASKAPHARDMHPTDEHLLPWFVAAGAARGAGLALRRVHEGVTFGCLGMDAYRAQPL
jgi:4,5-DOPA dioxygenase extradiol